MSSESFHRHHRRGLDAAISRAFTSIVHPFEHAAFEHLLEVARARSDLMAAAPVMVHHVLRFRQVDALRSLAHWHAERRGVLDRWPGARGHPLHVVDSLARHALGHYPTPRFLASVWFGGDRAAQGWFVAHARGQRFRSLPLPIALTRQMEHVFLALPDHLEVLPALRRAEVLGLGGSAALADAVVATRLGRRFANGDFWRTVLLWLVHRQVALDLAQVGPIVDYLDEIRHAEPTVDTPGGEVTHPPIAPTLSLRGRTVASLLRDVATWHLALGRREVRGARWRPARWQPYSYEEPEVDGQRVCWNVVELLDSGALWDEGRAMRHCVASYAWSCERGLSSIWSLRRRTVRARDLGRDRSVLTIEIDPRTARVVQVRGQANHRAGGAGLAVVRRWAARERLTLVEGTVVATA